MKTLSVVTFALLFIGGLNWGLVGMANLNPVSSLFGTGTLIPSVIYTLIGLAAIIQVGFFFTPSRQASTYPPR